MVNEFAHWKKLLRERGYVDGNDRQQRWNSDWDIGDNWKRIRCFNILGVPERIFEIFKANAYLRIVADAEGTPEKPFAVSHYVSTAHPRRPKQEWLTGQLYLVRLLSAAEIEKEIKRLL